MKLLQLRDRLASTLVPAIFGQSLVETMKAERLISCAVLDPDKAEMLVRAFDESWASIARNHADDPRVIESVRLELATIILALAQSNRRDAVAIAKSAIRLMRDY